MPNWIALRTVVSAKLLVCLAALPGALGSCYAQSPNVPPVEGNHSESPNSMQGLLDGLDLNDSQNTSLESPLLTAVLAMRSASEKLTDGDIGLTTQSHQSRAIQILDDLIRMAEAQSQQESDGLKEASQASSESSPTPPEELSAQESSLGPDNPLETNETESTADSTSEIPADDAGDSPTTPRASQSNANPLQASGEAIWGHLPEKTRGLLRAQVPTEFLPRYSQQISDYFRILAEMKSDG